MKFGVVGNREGWSYVEVSKKLQELNVYKSDLIVSGGAKGVDTYAQDFAKSIGARVLIIYPDLSKPSPQCYYKRNQEIVHECDILIAFNRKMDDGGTAYTIRYALDRSKRVIEVT